MNINNFDESSYYIFNPVIINIDDIVGDLRLNITLSGANFNFVFQPINGEVSLDISSIVRQIIPKIKTKTNILSEIDGAWKVTFSFSDKNLRIATLPRTKIFVLGGIDDYKNNLPVYQDLNISKYIFQGYPPVRSELSILENVEIINRVPHENEDLKKIYPKHNCEHFYVYFRNMRGGFSAYLFESFVIEEKNKSLGYYLNQNKINRSGAETDKVVKAQSKVIRGLYETVYQLGKSVEMYWWDNGDLKPLSGTNNISFDYKDNVTEVSMEFDIITNSNKVI